MKTAAPLRFAPFRIAFASVLTCVLLQPFVERASAQSALAPDTVMVESAGLRLRGLLYRPTGPGPFPAVLFNHGLGRAFGPQPNAGDVGGRRIRFPEGAAKVVESLVESW